MFENNIALKCAKCFEVGCLNTKSMTFETAKKKNILTKLGQIIKVK
jgi:hypothetical protein